MKILIVDSINNIPSHKQFQDLACRLFLEGYDVCHLSDNSRPNYCGVKVINYGGNIFKRIMLFYKSFKSFKPGLVISTFRGNLYVDLMSLIFRFKWFAFIQSDFYHRKWYNNFRFLKVSKMFVISHPMKSRVGKMYPVTRKKIEIIHNSFNFKVIESYSTEKKASILHVANSSLNSNQKLVKGTDLLIKAFDLIKFEVRKNIELIIVGGGEALDFLKANSKNVVGIKFLGKLSNTEVLNLMRESMILALPSRNEAFGQVFLEAMQYGCSLIGTEGTGAVDIIEEGEFGRVIPQEDIFALSKAMEILLKSYTYKGAVDAYSQKREQFSRERWVSTMIKHIEKSV